MDPARFAPGLFYGMTMNSNSAPQSIPASTTRELILWLVGRRRRLRVTGESMLPHLPPGQEVLTISPRHDGRPPQVGDVVVIRHPQQPETLILKRVAHVLPDGEYVLLGDNPAASTDSRTFGPMTQDKILGRIVCRFP